MFKGFFYIRRLTYIALVVITALPVYFFFINRYIKKKRVKQFINRTVLLGYLTVIIYFTLITKRPQNERLINFTPFWSYGKFFEVDYQWQIYMNILLFLPLGFLLPLTTDKMKGWFVVVFAIILSSMIEATQFFLQLGLCEFDDVFHNALGAWIGYLYCRFGKWLSSYALRRFTGE